MEKFGLTPKYNHLNPSLGSSWDLARRVLKQLIAFADVFGGARLRSFVTKLLSQMELCLNMNGLVGL